MKKLLVLLFSLLTFAALFSAASASNAKVIKEQPFVKVIVDGKQLTLNAVPVRYNERTLVGLRDLLVSLGVPNDNDHIKWNSENKTIEVVEGDVQISLAIGTTSAKVNGEVKVIDTEPLLYKGKTYIPARFVAENLSWKVFWEKQGGCVVICKEDTFKKLKDIPFLDHNYPKPYEYKLTEEFIKNNVSGYTLTENFQADDTKNIEAGEITFTSEGKTDTTKYYRNDTYVYQKAPGKNAWLRTLMDKAKLEKDSIRSAETEEPLLAAFYIKEQNDVNLILESDNIYFALEPTEDTGYDVTKDTTSKCHVVMSYSKKDSESQYKLMKMDFTLTGKSIQKGAAKPLKLIRTLEFNFDKEITVSIPSDINKYYTIPDGFIEHDTNPGSVFAPETWFLDNSDAGSPYIFFGNEKDEQKWCSILIEYERHNGTPYEINDIMKKAIIDSYKEDYPKYKLLKSSTFKWKGYNAFRVSFSGTEGTMATPMKMEITAIAHNGNLLVFTNLGELTTFDAKYKEAQSIINSWGIR